MTPGKLAFVRPGKRNKRKHKRSDLTNLLSPDKLQFQMLNGAISKKQYRRQLKKWEALEEATALSPRAQS